MDFGKAELCGPLLYLFWLCCADRHRPGKVNFWEDPMHPSKWKEEHFVLVSLAGWGAVIYGGYKLFTKGKEDKKEERVEERPH